MGFIQAVPDGNVQTLFHNFLHEATVLIQRFLETSLAEKVWKTKLM